MDSVQLSDEQQANVPEMVPKPRVEELIRKAKQTASDKARLEMEALHQQELEALRSNSPGMGIGGQKVDVDEIYSKIREKLFAEQSAEQEKLLQEQRQEQAHEIAKTFFDRIGTADREAYKDFDEVTGQLDIQKHANLVGLLTEFDNTADMLYELGVNPQKFASLSYFSNADPKYAFAQLKKLSESIKQNKQIKDAHLSANPPLTHMRPSASAGTDGGNMSISDLRKLKNLRG